MAKASCELSTFGENMTAEGIEYRNAPGLLVHRYEKLWKVTHMRSGHLLMTVTTWQAARDFAEEIAKSGDFTKPLDDLLADEALGKKVRAIRKVLPEDIKAE